jgi:hypothetical protein
VNKKGGRRPPSKMTRQRPTDKRAPNDNTKRNPMVIEKQGTRKKHSSKNHTVIEPQENKRRKKQQP